MKAKSSGAWSATGIMTLVIILSRFQVEALRKRAPLGSNSGDVIIPLMFGPHELYFDMMTELRMSEGRIQVAVDFEFNAALDFCALPPDCIRQYQSLQGCEQLVQLRP